MAQTIFILLITTVNIKCFVIIIIDNILYFVLKVWIK